MNLRILPAPTWWFALLYFVPTLVELYVVYVWWKRVPSYAVADQPRVRSNVLGATALIFAVAGIVALMLKSPQ
jgi:hypothetical protein